MATRSSPTTTSRSEPPGMMRIDVVYEQMRRKTVNELYDIIEFCQASENTNGRWYRTACDVLQERLSEVKEHGKPELRT